MPGHDGQTGFNRFGDKSLLMTALRLAGKSLPGDYVRTFVYLNLVYKPRLALRRLVNTFYRMDHVYSVIQEFKRGYKGPFSILEFGRLRVRKKSLCDALSRHGGQHRLPRLR